MAEIETYRINSSSRTNHHQRTMFTGTMDLSPDHDLTENCALTGKVPSTLFFLLRIPHQWCYYFPSYLFPLDSGEQLSLSTTEKLQTQQPMCPHVRFFFQFRRDERVRAHVQPGGVVYRVPWNAFAQGVYAVYLVRIYSRLWPPFNCRSCHPRTVPIDQKTRNQEV